LAPGGMMKVAAKLAQDIINKQQQILPGIELTTTFLDDHCDELESMRRVLDQVTTSSAWVGLGGMACPVVCTSTEIIASSVRLPVVEYGCAGSSPSQARSLGFVQMSTPTTVMPDLVSELAAQFGWARLKIVTESSPDSMKETQALVPALRERGLSVDWRSAATTDWEALLRAARWLLEGKAREVFLMGDEHFSRRIACAAKALRWLITSMAPSTSQHLGSHTAGTWMHLWTACATTPPGAS